MSEAKHIRKKSLPPPPRQGGLTLVEVLVSVAAASMIMASAVLIFGSASKVSRDLFRQSQRVKQLKRVLTVLDDEISLASGFPHRAQGYKAGASTLLLRRVDGALVIYQASEGRLERLALVDGKLRPEVLSYDLRAFRFEQQGRLLCYSFRLFDPVSKTSKAWEACHAL